MVFSKRIAVFAVDKEICQFTASYPLSASHSLLPVKVLLNISDSAVTIGKIIKSIFSERISVYDCPLGVNKPSISCSRFSILHVRHL